MHLCSIGKVLKDCGVEWRGWRVLQQYWSHPEDCHNMKHWIDGFVLLVGVRGIARTEDEYEGMGK